MAKISISFVTEKFASNKLPSFIMKVSSFRLTVSRSSSERSAFQKAKNQDAKILDPKKTDTGSVQSNSSAAYHVTVRRPMSAHNEAYTRCAHRYTRPLLSVRKHVTVGTQSCSRQHLRVVPLCAFMTVRACAQRHAFALTHWTTPVRAQASLCACVCAHARPYVCVLLCAPKLNTARTRHAAC
eukprot:6214805-Pleurochrysis_carterae.AAC.6